MRVPTITRYVNATFRLGNLTSDLQNANEVISTQKQINEISDDPLGLSQVLSIKNTLGNLEQVDQNIIMGKSWIESIENALDSVNELILSAKVDVTRLANDSTTADERNDAIERINSYIEQIMSLGNTQVNGNYIFSGTDIDIMPLEYNNILQQVEYKGNDVPFGIRSDKNSDVPVGRDGQETFWDKEIDINSTNNIIMFKEDNGHGSASEKILRAVIPSGLYTKDQLATVIRNTLNDASATDGYGLVYEVEYNEDTNKYTIREDGSYDGYIRTEFLWESGGEAYINKIAASSSINPDDINVDFLNRDSLTIGTPEPHGTEPFRLTWNGDNTWAVDNNPGYLIVPSTIPGTATSVGIDLDNSGSADIHISLDTPVTQRGQFIEFEIVTIKGDHSTGHEIGFAWENSIQAPPVSDTQAQYITELIIADGTNDEIIFEEVDSAGVATTLTADINTTGSDIIFTDMDALARTIELEMEAVSANGVNYAVSYDSRESRFIIREDGSSLDELNVLWSNSPAASATAATLGYYPLDDSITYPVSSLTQAHFTIDSTNNMLYFRETGGVTTVLGASVASGTYTNMADFETAIETAMNDASALSGNSVIYDVAYNPAIPQFEIQRSGGGALAALDLLWATNPERSIGETLGFSANNDTLGGLVGPYVSDSAPVLMTFDDTNNVIDFRETRIDNTVSDEISVVIPPGDYTSLDDVAAELQNALRDASPNRVSYIVDYDYALGQFMVKGSDAAIRSFSLLWQTGSNREQSADGMLGFYGDDIVSFSESDESVVNITIDATNNKIDFKEITAENIGKGVENLTASVKTKTYTSHDELAHEVEKALEAESLANGNRIDYSVSWDSYTQKFSIKENGTRLEQLDLLWQTGDNAPLAAGGTGQSIGGILGFDPVDDVEIPLTSAREVDWGIFNTLIDLRQYLEDNDRDGIERTIGRLELNYDMMTSRIVDAGMKFSRLEVRQTIISQVGLSLSERSSMIEDVDIVEAIMNLKNIETAYQAALSSTSKILNMSLVDYL